MIKLNMNILNKYYENEEYDKTVSIERIINKANVVFLIQCRNHKIVCSAPDCDR